MSMEQETLIYVEENDKSEARVLAQSFAKKEVKSRAYINALGAELGMKYLTLENINNSRLYNMHSVHRILEEFDISDIMLNNIHIDVRVVFDENYIFVPKSHFEYDILPDIYFVLLLAEDHSHASFLGFFEPKLINKNNQNAQYYFIEKEKLTAPANLKEFIEGFKGNTTHSLSDAENDKAELLMISMADQNISETEMKELLSMLQKSADLRDKFIEFENFELLAYKAQHSHEVKIPENIVSAAAVEVEAEEVLEEEVLGESEEIVEETDLVEDLETEEIALDEELSEEVDLGLGEVVEETPEIDTAVIAEPELGEEPEISEETEVDVLAGVELEETEETEADVLAGVEIAADTEADMVVGLGELTLDTEIEAPSDMAFETETAEETLEVEALADDVAGGLAAAGFASAAELSADIDMGVEAVLDVTESISDVVAEVSEPEDLVEDAISDTEISLSDVEVGSVSEFESMDELSSFGGEEVSEVAEVEFETDVESSSVAMDDLSLSGVDSDMTDMSSLASSTGANEFGDASLDDLMSSEEETEDVISMETLQEENARLKGLLPSIEDTSLVDKSLDFAKVEAVPQVDMNSLNAQLDTVDISGFDAIAPEVRLEEGSQHEEDILDISDVSATPNNFGDNISETVELNNFALVDNECENKNNKVGTAPTADFGSMPAFDPLDTGDMFIDDMSLEADMKSDENKPKRAASVAEVDLTGFESLDMGAFEKVPLVDKPIDTSFAVSKDTDDLATVLLGGASLDSFNDLPDVEGLPSDLQETSFEEEEPVKEESSGEILGVNPPGEPEMLSFDNDMSMAAPATPETMPMQEEVPVMETIDASMGIQNDVNELSVDDIVDSPEESDVNVDLISQAVDMEVAQDSLLEGGFGMEAVPEAMPVQEEVPAMETMDAPIMESMEVSDTPVEVADVVEEIPQEPQEVPVDPVSMEEESAPVEEETIGTPMEAMYSDSDNADLSMLFDEDYDNSMTNAVSPAIAPEESFVPTMPHMPQRQGSSGGKLIGAAVLVALLAGGIFFGLNMKNKNDLVESESLSQPMPETAETATGNETQPPVQENNEDIMANAPEVIDMPQNQAEPTNVKPEPAKDAKVAGAKPVNPEGSTMSVKKLSWELPDYLSYSQEMKKYLQTAGKSIKLTLTSDLLLASEYAYSNQVKVALKLSKDGAVQSANVVKSSGSQEIDGIVLQTVKETLNVVKPAAGEVPTPDFNLGLIITF